MDRQRIKSLSTFDAAVKAICEYIIGNRLAPGDTLPPEPFLARSLGISRNLLREALRHYRTLGLIESKPKVGTVIVSLIPENPYAGYFPILSAQTDLKPKLAEMRSALEVGFASRIIQCVTEADIVHLKKVCERFREACSSEQLTYADMEFHIALLEIPANPLLTGLIPLVVHFFSSATREDPSSARVDGKREYENHSAIVSALAAGDHEQLARLLRQHYTPYTEE